MTDTDQRADVQRRYLAVDAANVADVLDEMGYRDQGLSSDLGPIIGDRLAGWAFTIQGSMQSYEGTGDPAKMEACQAVGPSQVSVWAGGGAGVCYFGELIALGMVERGCTGALIDGGVRDTRVLRDHGFPVAGRYTSAVQSIGRWKVDDWAVPVEMPGATSATVVVNPGDFVLADEDGAVVIPADQALPVLERAEAMTQHETRIREELANGLSLSAALERFGHV